MANLLRLFLISACFQRYWCTNDTPKISRSHSTSHPNIQPKLKAKPQLAAVIWEENEIQHLNKTENTSTMSLDDGTDKTTEQPKTRRMVSTIPISESPPNHSSILTMQYKSSNPTPSLVQNISTSNKTGQNGTMISSTVAGNLIGRGVNKALVATDVKHDDVKSLHTHIKGSEHVGTFRMLALSNQGKVAKVKMSSRRKSRFKKKSFSDQPIDIPKISVTEQGGESRHDPSDSGKAKYKVPEFPGSHIERNMKNETKNPKNPTLVKSENSGKRFYKELVNVLVKGIVDKLMESVNNGKTVPHRDPPIKTYKVSTGVAKVKSNITVPKTSKLNNETKNESPSIISVVVLFSIFITSFSLGTLICMALRRSLTFLKNMICQTYFQRRSRVNTYVKVPTESVASSTASDSDDQEESDVSDKRELENVIVDKVDSSFDDLILYRCDKLREMLLEDNTRDISNINNHLCSALNHDDDTMDTADDSQNNRVLNSTRHLYPSLGGLSEEDILNSLEETDVRSTDQVHFNERGDQG